VILGPNGAGKSLLLRLLHGLIAPGAGTILWRGAAPGRGARHAQAMVFQSPVMLRRSALGNLNFALSVQGFAGRERARRAERALEMAGLTALARQPARLMSGGEQQRLAIARALALGPELLILDEPTASLDPAETRRIEHLIDAAHGEGVTVLMTSHDQGQVRRLADDIVFLSAGRVAEQGPAADILDRPSHAATKAWLAGDLYIPPHPS
jgi:tungstate transport system ATP-binding protein